MDISRITTALGLTPSFTTVKTVEYATATGVPMTTVVVRETAEGRLTIDASTEAVQDIINGLANDEECEPRQDGVLNLDDCLVPLNRRDIQRDGVYRAPEGFGVSWIAVSRYGTTGHSTRAEARKALAEAHHRVSVMDAISWDQQ